MSNDVAQTVTIGIHALGFPVLQLASGAAPKHGSIICKPFVDGNNIGGLIR